MEIESNSQNISKKSSKSSKISKKKSADIISDIDLSELELLANRKKLNKKTEEFTVKEKTSIKDKSKEKTRKEILSSSIRKVSSISSYDSDNKHRARKLNKENKSESTIKEKMELLIKLTTLVNNNHGKYTSKMTIDNTLDEIKADFTRIKSTSDNEKMVKFCKHGLIMGIKGVEYLNSTYDPLGVDLDGWGESLQYNMESSEYDDVLSELYEKYKGSGSMSPEIKLVMMIVMSGAMFSFSKKIAKNPDTFSSMLQSFMPPKQQMPQQQMSQQQMPQQQMPQQQMPQQQMPQQQMSQQHYGQMPQQNYSQQFMVPGFSPLINNRDNRDNRDNNSEDSDRIPSKIRGPPNTFDTPDSVNIENIMRQMQQQKQQKQNDIEKLINEKVGENTESESVGMLRNVNIKPKRGRPANKKAKAVRN